MISTAIPVVTIGVAIILAYLCAIGFDIENMMAPQNMSMGLYGIGIAAVAGLVFGCPVVFAKKTKSRNVSDDAYTTVVHSFTHGNDNTIRISREYLSARDRVLVIDDFLANGAALDGLITLIESAGATVVGAGIAVEKAFQPGGARIRARGYRVESLARVQSMAPETGIVFC